MLIVAGGRDFTDYELLKTKLDYFTKEIDEQLVIVSGGANGADALGQRYADERGYDCALFKADWQTHGKAAGYLRNRRMADYSSHLVAFWDGESKGTKHMIDIAIELGLNTRVVKY